MRPASHSVIACYGIALSPAQAHSNKAPTRDVPEHALWLLKRVFHQGHRTVSEAVRPYGVTPTEMGALNRLVDEPGLSGAELARRMLVTPQAAQLSLTALEKRGLVERTPDATHGRIVRTHLTEEGRRVWEVCRAISLDAEDEFLAVLNAEERQTLIELLRRLANSGSRLNAN
jgi:DNA-binding MarR family transcriptional regulator